MNTTLKLDGRTVRGRQWKDLNDSGQPLKQGVLLSKKACSKCNEAPDEEAVIEYVLSSTFSYFLFAETC